jgi:hypothetical protein
MQLPFQTLYPLKKLVRHVWSFKFPVLALPSLNERCQIEHSPERVSSGRAGQPVSPLPDPLSAKQVYGV